MNLANLTPMFHLAVKVEMPLALDDQSAGPVRMVPITGGTVSGRLSGNIVPGGADWQVVLPDGAIEIDARYLLELDDGCRIELRSTGMRGAAAEAFWSPIRLTTTAAKHRELQRSQFLGLGRKVGSTVLIDVYELPQPDLVDG